MTLDALKLRFPNASAAFLQANLPLHFDGEAPAPELERDLRVRPLAKGKAQKGDPRRFFVRVTSYRRRLLDEDNLCEKYVVDCLRYSGLLPDDAPGQARIVTTQEKVGSKEEERTQIEVSVMP